MLGNLPEWVGAIGTIGAFAASLILIGRQVGEWKLSAEELASYLVRL